MASKFELVASLIAKDRFFMEVDEYDFKGLLTSIMRTCHDLNDQKFDAESLASEIASLVADWVGLTYFPEDEGSGFTDWEKADAEAAVGATDATPDTGSNIA